MKGDDQRGLALFEVLLNRDAVVFDKLLLQENVLHIEASQFSFGGFLRDLGRFALIDQLFTRDLHLLIDRRGIHTLSGHSEGVHSSNLHCDIPCNLRIADVTLKLNQNTKLVSGVDIVEYLTVSLDQRS